LGVMFDVARYGPHGPKVSLLCQRSYVWSTRTKYNLRFDRHISWNCHTKRKLWQDSYRTFHVRSRLCVETNITRLPFRRRISFLYLSNTRYQLSFTSMYPGKQSNKQTSSTDLLQIVGPLESHPTCSDTQQDVSWVERANWQSFISLWPVAYYIFLRSFHFSWLSSSPFPRQQVMAPQTPQPSVIQSESRRMAGASSNAPQAETQLLGRHLFVHCNSAIAATENMAQDVHLRKVHKTGRSNNRQQHTIGCE